MLPAVPLQWVMSTLKQGFKKKVGVSFVFSEK